MKAPLQHSFRTVVGVFRFVVVVIVAFFDYFFSCVLVANDSLSAEQALWLHRNSCRALKIFKLKMSVKGQVPSRGLLISNHLSYLDILVISSITPALFVAKRDVKSWPIVGWLAQMAGSLFVDRERRIKVGEINREIKAALDKGMLVVLFPEGTSSGGHSVLPFKSALLEPAMHGSYPISIGSIEYEMKSGDASHEICYWGDHTFFPHLVNLLGKRRFSVIVQFSPFTEATTDRKRMATLLHSGIRELKQKGKTEEQLGGRQMPLLASFLFGFLL
jgi:lyso-ornithine lipid O-acyltransferase